MGTELIICSAPWFGTLVLALSLSVICFHLALIGRSLCSGKNNGRIADLYRVFDFSHCSISTENRIPRPNLTAMGEQGGSS